MNQVVLERDIVSAIPLPAPGMTRREKLMRWAQLIRNAPHVMYLMHNLERWSRDQLQAPSFYINSANIAFSLAMSDKVLADAGLQSSTTALEPGSGSIADIMNFMEITQSQLHEFSCDCGGAITNTDMADRIERLA